MSTLYVELGTRSYPITIDASLLKDASAFKKHISASNVVIVTNDTIAPLYLDTLTSTLADQQIHTVIIPDGESFKTLTQLEDIVGQLLQKGCSRDTILIALGGGVVGDLCGFVASVFQRGVPFIQVPTTLLSQVDSSVGGKTAVNHALGKNLIGAFYQPQAVVIDTDCLATLPKREFTAGMAEVIKYGIIYDAEFFEWLETNKQAIQNLDQVAITKTIHRCCEIKAEIVAQDERESGIRALLNLGHTFGHAIEAEMGYGAWLHGEAVAAGMVIACHVAEQQNWMSASEVRRVIDLLAFFDLPVSGPDSMGYSDYMPHMQHDKKVQAGKVRFVIPKGIGNACVTSDISSELLYKVLG